MVPKVDQAFAAMIEDLKDRGMLDHVLVIMMSEFGRTPRGEHRKRSGRRSAP